MRRIHFACVPLATLAVLAAATASAQDAPQDPKVLVEDVIARAESADLKSLWTLADELIAAGRSKATRDAISRSLKKAAPRAVLVLSRALLQIEKDNFTDDVARALVAVLKQNGPEAETAALLLGSKQLALESADQDNLTSDLENLIARGELSSMARLGAAQTLWRLGRGEQRALAMREMRNFYKSENTELKTAGALAIAQCDDIESVRPFLKTLQNEPSERGRMARMLIEHDEYQRLAEARLSRALVREDGSAPVKLDPTDPRVLNEILDMVEQLHVQGNEWKREELLAAAARGLLNELDPHTTFFTASEYAKMIQDLKQVYAGIGAQVRVIGREFTIVRPFFSAPAYKAGIRAGDRVVSIISEKDGVEGEWSTDGQPEDEVIKRLKGQPGTNLKLKVFRRGWTEPKTLSLKRELIKIPLLESELLPGGIAYFDLMQFGDEVAGQLGAELKKMVSDGVLKGVVLDLRNNPGGFLEAAQNLCALFLQKNQLVCYTEGRNDSRRDFRTRRAPVVPDDVPVVVLINSFSASASEITAGALQDHGRAIVIGEHSFGKGSVQQMFPLRSLPDESFDDKDGNGIHDDWEPFKDENGNGKFDPGPRVKITIERYFLPKGRNVNTEYDHEKRKVRRGGIEPDLTVEWPIMDLGREAEIQRISAEEKLINYVRDQWQKNPELLKQLALGDGKDWNKYPEFDELFTSLKTWVDKNDVRKLLRWKVRDRVAEERGKMFPGYAFQGDVQEDPQLRQAMAEIYEKLGTKFESNEQFAKLLEREKALQINFGPRPDAELKAQAASRPAEK